MELELSPRPNRVVSVLSANQVSGNHHKNVIFLCHFSFSFLVFFHIYLFSFLSIFRDFLLELTYSVVPVSAVQQSDPVTHTHSFSHAIPSIMFCPKRLDTVPCAVQKDPVAYPF